MKTLKRAFVLVLVLALAISGIAIVSAISHFDPGYSYNNGTASVETSSERPTTNVDTHTYYVGEIEKPDSTQALGSEANPFPTVYSAVNAFVKGNIQDGVGGTFPKYLQYVKYVDAKDHLDEVELVFVGDTYETTQLPEIRGGILTLVAKEGLNPTIHIGTESKSYGDNGFIRAWPDDSGEYYLEINFGTPNMAATGATLTFDGTYYGSAGTELRSVLSLGYNGTKSVVIGNMYDGVTIKNIRYNENTNSLVTSTQGNGNAVSVQYGMFKMYGGTITQNYCKAAIDCIKKGTAFVYGGEIVNNYAYALFTNDSNATITVYDCLVQNNYNDKGAIYSNNGGKMFIYGGQFLDNASAASYADVFINPANIYIADVEGGNVTMRHGSFTRLAGSTPCMTVKPYGSGTPVYIESRIFFAKDGSAYAYGYSEAKKTIVEDNKVIPDFNGDFDFLTVEIGKNSYLYRSPNTTSCAEYYNEYGPNSKITADENMKSGVYYYGEKVAPHSYEIIDSLAPTLDTDGYYIWQCSVCGDSYTETIPKLSEIECNHEWQYEKIEPNCTEGGYTLQKCDKCGTELKIDIKPANGHDYYVDEELPTCLAPGYIDVTCNNCDLHEHTEYDQLDHNYVREINYPTKVYHCVNGCDDTYEKLFISYYENMNTWSSELAFNGEDPNSKYTADIEMGQKITIGKTLDGEDIGHQKDDGTKKFFGWFTAQGDIYEYGDEIVVTNNLVLYEFYGYEVKNNDEFKAHYGEQMRLTEDLLRTDYSLKDNAQGSNRTIIDLNGHNITYAANANGTGNMNKNAFQFKRMGLILIGKGTINYQAANPETHSFLYTEVSGSDNSRENLAHTLWIGKDVTLITNTKLLSYTNGATTVPMIRIAGTVVAPYICDAVHADIEIFPTANITLTGDYIANIGGTDFDDLSEGLTMYVYGGTINLPENADESYFFTNASGNKYSATYLISGGIFNKSVPSEFMCYGYGMYYNSMYSNKYFVIPNCTEEEHNFGKVSSDVTCTTAGHAVYACSHCGVQLIFDEDALGHLKDKLVIVYPNGFDKVGDEVYKCSRCNETQETLVGVVVPILTAKGYAVDLEGTTIMGGYNVDYKALEAYETTNNTVLEYGVLFVNVNNEDVDEITFENGVIQTSAIMKAIQTKFDKSVTDENGNPYASFNYKVSNFVPSETKYADLKIVIAAYVIEREKTENEEELGEIKGVSFVQSEPKGNSTLSDSGEVDSEGFKYQKTVSVTGTNVKEGTTLGAVTLRNLYQNSDFKSNYNNYFTAQN